MGNPLRSVDFRELIAPLPADVKAELVYRFRIAGRVLFCARDVLEILDALDKVRGAVETLTVVPDSRMRELRDIVAAGFPAEMRSEATPQDGR